MEPEEQPPKTPLPEGWEQAVSPVDGRVYYYNPSSNATSWTHPSIPGSTTIPGAPPKELEAAPSLGEYSGIIANRSTVDYDVEKAASEDIYTKMTDYDPKQPINSHRWYSVIAMILFFPLGAIAFCRSLSTVSNWHQEKYEKAHDHSQQTLLFSRIACIVGVIFWGYFAYCFFAGPAAPFVMEIPAEWWPKWHWHWK